ncbi:MAG: hypothetical protein ACM3SU_16765 [Acidobacteriota bacterium]
MIRQEGRGEGGRLRGAPSRPEILRDFEKLIEEGKLSGAAHDPAIVDGAEFDRKVLKKKGKGTRFLVRKVPSRGKLLRLWARIFENSISPRALLEALSPKTLELEHREMLLLFGRSWIMYDAEIFRGDESAGELTLSFSRRADPKLGLLALLRGARRRVVRIEHIRLASQKSGYASALFRHYEHLFRELGFDQFRLSASLSVGKYYWAKEGFDFSDESEIGKRRGELRALVKEKGLPVSEAEIDGLRHAYDFADFRRDVKIPAYRDAEGYYSLKRDDRFREEVLLPLGKAFLLSGAPWEGHKPIPASQETGATSALSSA